MDIRELHVIDVDAHITEPPDLWSRRAPARFIDRVPRVVDVDGVPMWSFDGVLLGRVNLSSVIRPSGEKVPGPAFFEFERDEIHPASSDMRARLELLDGQGIHAARRPRASAASTSAATHSCAARPSCGGPSGSRSGMHVQSIASR